MRAGLSSVIGRMWNETRSGERSRSNLSLISTSFLSTILIQGKMSKTYPPPITGASRWLLKQLACCHQVILDQRNEREPTGMGSWTSVLGKSKMGLLPLRRRVILYDQKRRDEGQAPRVFQPIWPQVISALFLLCARIFQQWILEWGHILLDQLTTSGPSVTIWWIVIEKEAINSQPLISQHYLAAYNWCHRIYISWNKGFFLKWLSLM